MVRLAASEEVVEIKRADEKWSIWSVQDRQPIIIKGRSLLTKVIRTGQFNDLGEPIYHLQGNNIFTTFAPKELKGEPTREIPPVDKVLKDPNLYSELDFKVLEEPWCIYELEDGTKIKSKLVGLAFLKTKYFDQNGDPYFIIQSSTLARIIVNPELRKKT